MQLLFILIVILFIIYIDFGNKHIRRQATSRNHNGYRWGGWERDHSKYTLQFQPTTNVPIAQTSARKANLVRSAQSTVTPLTQSSQTQMSKVTSPTSPNNEASNEIDMGISSTPRSFKRIKSSSTRKRGSAKL